MRTLKTGPAMHPVIAISPNPFLVIATLAFMSPRQLPHASSVSPRRVLGRPSITPNNESRSTTMSQVNEIQRMLITKAIIAYRKISFSGGYVIFVHILM